MWRFDGDMSNNFAPEGIPDEMGLLDFEDRKPIDHGIGELRNAQDFSWTLTPSKARQIESVNGAEEIVFADLRNDTIALAAFTNGNPDGERLREDGFELFGNRYYGNALIVPDEGYDSPRISPQETARLINFFRVENNSKAERDRMHKVWWVGCFEHP